MVAKENYGHDLDFSKKQSKRKEKVLVFEDSSTTNIEEDDFAEPAVLYQGNKEDNE